MFDKPTVKIYIKYSKYLKNVKLCSIISKVNKIYTVYAVRYDKVVTWFLVYGNGIWRWIEAYKFDPIAE